MPFNVNVDYAGQSFDLSFPTFEAAIELVTTVRSAGGLATIWTSTEQTRVNTPDQAELRKLRILMAAQLAHASKESSERDQG